MPVFARTKLVIHDDCLTPQASFATIEYKGPNPQELYKKIRELLVTIWKVDPGDVQEREFSWDRSAAAEKFKVRFEVVKDLDTFSFFFIRINLSGEAKHSREFGREGSAKIELDVCLRTEYPQDTIWQRSLIYEMFRMLWHKAIYQSMRQRYLQECRELSERFAEEIKSFLNTLPKSY
ncbi:MAG: hypothetical protein QW040_03825 [Candidatus Aenigmatarchaeota archaeon]